MGVGFPRSQYEYCLASKYASDGIIRYILMCDASDDCYSDLMERVRTLRCDSGFSVCPMSNSDTGIIIGWVVMRACHPMTIDRQRQEMESCLTSMRQDWAGMVETGIPHLYDYNDARIGVLIPRFHFRVEETS
jgi:hypothetical protein